MLGFYRRFRWYIWASAMLAVAVGGIAISTHRRRRHERHVEQLTLSVLQILAEQDAINRRNPTVASAISVHQIRDALFLKASTRIKNRIWPAVCKAISRNSSVRESVMSIKGEQHRVWEWIGSDVLNPLHHSPLLLNSSPL